MRAWAPLENRLFRYDRRIAINIVRANVAGWRDRLFVGAALVLMLVIARSWLGGHSWKIAAWTAFGVNAAAGMGVARALAARIAFHSTDGLLAADAMKSLPRQNYMVAWHGVAITISTLVVLIARPSLIVISVPAYLAGALLGAVAARVAVKWPAFSTAAIPWAIRSWLHRPGAGIVAALTLLATLFAARTLETKGVLAIVGMEAALFALALTLVEHEVVRFKARSGHRPWRIVMDYAVGLLLFAAIAAPTCCIAMGPVPAGIVLAVSVAMLLLMVMRVLSYCVHDKRFADLLVSMLGGLFVLVAYSMFVLLPFILIAILWQLRRSAAERTWLLA